MPQAALLQFPAMAKLAPEDRPNRLYALRKARDLTLQDLAERTNLSRAHVQKLETGERELSKPVMERLARALGVPEADLLNVRRRRPVARERAAGR
jgi:transcriptional regulator with XRE-family HTH domain